MRIDRGLRRMRVIAGVIAALIASASLPHPPLVIYNRTPSVPIGFYLYHGGRIQRGSIVAFALPASAYSYTRLRGEPTNLILLKHVLAAGGDFVSTLDGELRVNGFRVGPIAAFDSAGRPLPHWSAARRLAADELLVGSAAVRSFDSRYFGPIHTDQVLGVYRKVGISFSFADESDPSSHIDMGKKESVTIGEILFSTQGKIKAGYQPDIEAIEPQGLTANSLARRLYINDISVRQISNYRYQRGILGDKP